MGAAGSTDPGVITPASSTFNDACPIYFRIHPNHHPLQIGIRKVERIFLDMQRKPLQVETILNKIEIFARIALIF